MADTRGTLLPMVAYGHDAWRRTRFQPDTSVCRRLGDGILSDDSGFLVLLLLSKENIDLTLLRVTALVGFIIGCYNMGNFATDAGFYLGLYHLPLVGISLYALLKSKRKNKI